MEYHDEADEDADRSPQQVGDPEAEGHALLAIDGTGRLLELILLQQRCDLDLLPVLGGPPPAPRPMRRRGCRREIGHAVAFDARDQMVSVGQQPANDLADRKST